MRNISFTVVTALQVAITASAALNFGRPVFFNTANIASNERKLAEKNQLNNCQATSNFDYIRPKKERSRKEFIFIVASLSFAGIVSAGSASVVASVDATEAITNSGYLVSPERDSFDKRYCIAGAAAASFSHGITTPVDVVKTRIQAAPSMYTGGVINAVTHILRKDGPTAFLDGLGATIIGYGMEGAVKFGLYETLKPHLMDISIGITGHVSTDHTIPYLAASVIAGALASIVLCPIESIRIQAVTNPNFSSGFHNAFTSILEEKGVAALFYGLAPMLTKQIPYTMAKQVSFDTFTSMLYMLASQLSLELIVPLSQEKFGVSVASAFLASIIACISSHPGDVLLTETYRKRSETVGFVDLISNINRMRGLNGFFTGLPARLIHVSTVITSQLVIYDYVKQMLGLPATGC